jgi:hypothetical protein
VPETFVNGLTLHAILSCCYNKLDAVPQAVSLSTCQWIPPQMSYGTEILISAVRSIIAFEAIVL